MATKVFTSGLEKSVEGSNRVLFQRQSVVNRPVAKSRFPRLGPLIIWEFAPNDQAFSIYDRYEINKLSSTLI